ncbi:unnamed protein product [Chrysodeixis includens]|uniref:GP-PDE domain-containing protein n=1 Tax=Chrysodeixis includens TaxID=689277 RepID=A0A9P0C0F6_CHRIL|nr:unnamed protein product [Chrysodeixis includens]
MATCAMRTVWHASGGTLKSSSIYPKTLLNALASPNAPSSIIIHTQKRSLFVLPFGLDVGLIGLSAYYLTRLRKPEPENVINIFGPEPWSKESQTSPEKVVRCIAHRGAGLDAPENTLEAFKYCVERDCNIVELDVRTSKDGKLLLLHDQGLERLTGKDITNVHVMDWDKIKDIDIGATHPNRKQFKEVKLCLLDDALDYLMAHKVRVISSCQETTNQVVNGILKTFASRPTLYQYGRHLFQLLYCTRSQNDNPQDNWARSATDRTAFIWDYNARQRPNNPKVRGQPGDPRLAARGGRCARAAVALERALVCRQRCAAAQGHRQPVSIHSLSVCLSV